MSEFRDSHLTADGDVKARFRSYDDAEFFIQKRNLQGVHSYWCSRCRGIHIGHPTADPAKISSSRTTRLRRSSADDGKA